MQDKYTAPALFIDGQWIAETGTSEPIYNPATGDQIGRLPHAGDPELDAALAGAARGFETWRRMSPAERGRIMTRAASYLRELADEAARHIVLEQGKPMAEARIEIESCAGMLEWYAEAGQRVENNVLEPRMGYPRREVVKEPIGPVAAFSPWNFPASIPARKVSAALAAGCSVIVKPAEETPAGFGYVARALDAAGLPDGVLNVVYGDPSQISARLIDSPVIRKISFTGSTRVGQIIGERAGRHAKPCALELGGHSPVLVMPGADVELAVQRSVAAKFRNGGQICGSPTRFYIHDSLFERFADRFVETVAALRVGDGLDPETQLGPMVNPRRVDALHALVEDATAAGANLRIGGERSNSAGSYYRPTVLQDVPESARVMQEEPFGPLVILNRYSDDEEAMALANGTPYALAAYAFAGSRDQLDWAARELDAGLVGLNSYAVVFPDAPITGRRASGYGNDGGMEGLEEFLINKFVALEG